MIDIVWKLSLSTLERESEVGPLIAQIVRTEGFEPVRYDLNQRGKWKPFDFDRAVVDALTQRTQLVRIDGSGQASDDERASGPSGVEGRTREIGRAHV